MAHEYTLASGGVVQRSAGLLRAITGTFANKMKEVMFSPPCVTDGRRLEQASQWYEMYYHDLEVMSLNVNPDRVELWVWSTPVPSRT